MGILSALGKIGSFALDLVPGGAAAKTGVKIAKGLAKGASLAGDLGSVAGKQQQGATDGRIAQANLNQNQDRNAINLYQAQQGAENSAGQLDLQRKGFETGNRSATAKQALIGALLGGKIDPTILRPDGQSSGGMLRALQANPEALAAMKLMGSQGAEAQNTPLAFQGGQMLKAPGLTPLADVDKGGFMSTLATIGQLAGAASPHLEDLLKQAGPQSPPFVGSNNGPQLAGVTPFVKPPTAKFPYPFPADGDDWSNR